jgi:hypothetical protein
MQTEKNALPQYPGPADWRAADMRESGDWLYTLSDAEREELTAAGRACERAGVPLVDITVEDFPLPALGPTLTALQRDVIEGRGFVLLRGVPVDGLSREFVARLLLGIGAWFGEPVSQNRLGHLLGHVKDLGNDPLDPMTRIYTTTFRHLFHTDSCDMVALMCLQKAKCGGESAIASSTALYNALAERRPDLARVLAEPFVIDRKGEIPVGKGPTYEMPVFNHYEGRVSTLYARDFITAAQERPEVPRLRPEQVEALDLLDSMAESDEFRLDMAFEPGDMQVLHNHQVLHARTAYEDYPEQERKRHLLRLWLSARNGRVLPPVYAERYGEIRVGRRRGGIMVPGMEFTAPLEAE